jgi:light-regulated signal transduction histidine kinase (bacteriophytochrome)
MSAEGDMFKGDRRVPIQIQAFGDRLQTRFGEAIPDEGRDYLSRMLTSAHRMRRLIDDLLTYSRVSTQAKPFDRHRAFAPGPTARLDCRLS